MDRILVKIMGAGYDELCSECSSVRGRTLLRQFLKACCLVLHLVVLMAGGSRSLLNRTIPCPKLLASQCPKCDAWIDLGGAPGTIPRDG